MGRGESPEPWLEDEEDLITGTHRTAENKDFTLKGTHRSCVPWDPAGQGVMTSQEPGPGLPAGLGEDLGRQGAGLGTSVETKTWW